MCVCGVLRRDSVDSLLLFFFFCPVLFLLKKEPSIKKERSELKTIHNFHDFH